MNTNISSTLGTIRMSAPCSVSLHSPFRTSNARRAPTARNIKMPRNLTKSFLDTSLTCVHERSPPEADTITASSAAARLQLLVSEFKSLTEPIDRVKRLLEYAALLPALDESGRVQANRVSGCATQVWVEVGVDERGRMRFRADSDSEISKGFCSCLIKVLDGAEAEEVLGFKGEDLREMNVGVSTGKAASRVNTWQNVLAGMQKRTLRLVMNR